MDHYVCQPHKAPYLACLQPRAGQLIGPIFQQEMVLQCESDGSVSWSLSTKPAKMPENTLLDFNIILFRHRPYNGFAQILPGDSCTPAGQRSTTSFGIRIDRELT